MYLNTIIAVSILILTANADAGSDFILAPTAKCHPYADLIDNKDGTLTDTRNGLIWMRCDIGTKFKSGQGCIGKAEEMSWSNAMVAARRLSDKEKYNWRLPTLKEVRQIVDDQSNCYPQTSGWHSPVVGAAAIDLRLFSESPGHDLYRILTLDPYEESLYGGWPSATVWKVDLRYGFAPSTYGESKAQIVTLPDFSNANGKGFVKLVRQTDNADDANMILANNLFDKWVSAPLKRKEEERLQRNAIADERNRQEKLKRDELTRKTNAAKQ